MLNEMLDLVESGLEQGQDREGKSNFLMVELTLTTSIQKTATSTRTTTASCVAGTFTECSRLPDGLQEARWSKANSHGCKLLAGDSVISAQNQTSL